MAAAAGWSSPGAGREPAAEVEHHGNEASSVGFGRSWGFFLSMDWMSSLASMDTYFGNLIAEGPTFILLRGGG